jgi:hypothetical protein
LIRELQNVRHVCTAALVDNARHTTIRPNFPPINFRRADTFLSCRVADTPHSWQQFCRCQFLTILSSVVVSVPVFVRVRKPCPNRNRARSRRRVQMGEQRFPCVHQKPGRASPSLLERCGRARQQPSLHSAPRSQNAPQSSGFQVIATLRSTPSWSSSRKFAAVAAPKRRSACTLA